MLSCKGCVRENSAWNQEAIEVCNHCKRAYAGADMDYHNDKYEASTDNVIAKTKESNSINTESNSTFKTNELYRRESEFILFGIITICWFVSLLSCIF